MLFYCSIKTVMSKPIHPYDFSCENDFYDEFSMMSFASGLLDKYYL